MPTLSITVNRVCYPPSTSDPDAWYILDTSQGTCKGRMAWRPQDREALILEGEWAVYKGNREFAFSAARIDIPVDPRDQLRYVCARTTGAGPALEELIWAHAGDGWLDIAEGAVPRLHGKLFANFRLQCESIVAKSEEAKVVAALMGKGATMNMAVKAWAAWESETLGVVNADPYRLAELDGYSFRDVDGDIRRAYGIGDADPRRIKAAVVYALRRLTDAGDTLVDWADLYQQSTGLLHGYAAEVSDCTAALFEDGTLRAFAGCGGVALAADWRAETEIWEWVTGAKQQQEDAET